MALKRLFHYIWFVFIFVSTLEGAEFYALLIGDTHDSSIGKSAKTDIKNMKKEVSKIASNAGLNLHLTVYEGNDATVENVLNYINNLNPGNDDVVLFYNTSHGYHKRSQKDPWPNIYLGHSKIGFNFESVNNILMNKNPRLLISIADACNNTFEDHEAPQTLLEKRFGLADDNKKVKQNYRTLFTKKRGVYIASASKAGEYSYSYLSRGSLFTLGFLDAIKSETSKASDPSWYTIMCNSVENTKTRAIEVKATQEPQFIYRED